MESVVENVRKRGESLLAHVEEFLQHRSRILYRPVNRPGSEIIVIGSSDYRWAELDETDAQRQTKLLRDCARFFGVLDVLLLGQIPSCLKEVRHAKGDFLELVSQEKECWHKSLEEAVQAARDAMRAILGSLSRLYDPIGGEFCYVPDTNALLHNTQLEEWVFGGSPAFTLVLTPSVLSELDDLKVRGNDKVQPKAEKLVRQIKEYSRRGDLTEGVTLTKDRSRIRALAVEPDMKHTLSWLDRDNNDDRFIASFLEVMRQHPRSVVVLVSRDVNVHNKANFALMPVVDPPEPFTHVKP